MDTTQANNAVGNVPTPGASPTPRNTWKIIALILAAALVVAATVIGLLLANPPLPASPPPATTSTVTTTVTQDVTANQPQDNPAIATDPPVLALMGDLVLPPLPNLQTGAITVNNGGEPANIGAFQKLADDVAAGNVDKITASCWTQPAADLRAVYGSTNMRGAILQALQQTPQMAQGGVTWQGSYVTVRAYWEEQDSAYPCPTISWDDNQPGLGDFTLAMARWRIQRILAVQDGNPVHSGDGTNYALICDTYCNDMWAPHNPNPVYQSGQDVPILSATTAQWQRLRALSQAQIAVEKLANGYFRVRAADGSTDALAYFTSTYTDYALPCVLGEID